MQPKKFDPIPISGPVVRGMPEHQDMFRTLVESVRDYAIFMLDPDGHVLTWNKGAEALKGYSREEIVGKHFSIFYPPEAISSGWPQHELELAEKQGRLSDEGWRLKKDGSSFWASVVITALHSPNGQLVGFAKVTQDLSARRQNEERIQLLNNDLRAKVAELDEAKRTVELRTLELQKLSGDLLRVQDEERRRLARELHDDLGQKLIAAKLSMPTGGQSQEVIEILDDAMASVRNLSYLLHPPLLDESGLHSALHWFIEGMQKRSGIKISLVFTPSTFPRLSEDIETTIFRVVQESLTNVYRHSKSPSARVEIEKQPEWVTIRVRDHGVGLPLTSYAKGPSKIGVGVSGMRERLRQFGGDLTVSRADPGTLVEGKLPLS
jgi:PAS domain S-box-containing protein